MTSTRNEKNDQVLLKRGVIYLILWLVFLWQMWPKFRGFADTGVIDIFNQPLQGNHAIAVLMVLVLICIGLCAIGLKDIITHFKGRATDHDGD